MSDEAFNGLHAELTNRIIRVFYDVHNELGFGFLESVYSKAMTIALLQAGLPVALEVAVPVVFRGELVGSFRADLVVADCVILELKTAEQITKSHEAQLTHYLRATRFEVGLVLNFGEQPRVRRVEFLNYRKQRLIPSAPIPS